jgi:competence protein ComEC
VGREIGAMPLIVVSLGCYIAGLLSGFAGESDSLLAAFVLAGVAVALGWKRGAAIATTFGLLVAAGFFMARAATASSNACATTSARRETLSIIVDDSVGPGGYVGGEAINCGRAWLTVDAGDAPAGARVAATGDVARTQRGLLVDHATISVSRGPSLLVRWRQAAGRAIDRTFGGDAPLVRALLIADRSELAPEVRDRFAAAGLAHILAIAGLHVGIIALAIEIVLQLAGVPRTRANVVTIAAILVYVAIIGAPIPAVRSAVMLTAFLTSRLAQRPTSRWAIVALGAAQPLLDPRVVLDAGYQLSVVGVTSMIAAARLARRIGVHRLPSLGRAPALILVATTVATIGSAPIVAWVFGRISLAAPLTNLLATPLIELAQPMLFAGMLLAPIHPLASLLADAAHPLLASLDHVASVAAGTPGASVLVSPTPACAAIAAVLSAAFIVACASRDWRAPASIAAVAGVMLIWLPIASAHVATRADGELELHMIDVGQGDAIALRTPHGHWILVDAGRAWRGGDAGHQTVVPYLGRRGGPLDVFILSHPHTDHVGGAATVLDALHPATYVDAGFPGPAEAYRASLDAAKRDHVRWVRAHPNDEMAVDGVSLEFLAPDSTWTASLVDPNLASVIVLVRYGEVRMLLMGDAEEPEEDWLLANERDELHADVLKVGHHGSKTSSSERFLDAVSPRLALVSVGAGNSYHLPTPAIMTRLAAHGARVLRTDQVGTIVARTDGHRLTIDAAGDTWDLPPRSAVPHEP